MIVSCDHNNGAMGLCSDCQSQVSRSVERTSQAVKRDNDLTLAADIADRYGCHDAARELRRARDTRR